MKMLHESKNMDQIEQSIRSLPLAWSMAFCRDLKEGGKKTMELGEIHL